MNAGFLGHRVYDHDAFWAHVGVFWAWQGSADGETIHRWFVRPPCGHHFMLASEPGKPMHYVEEHEDGMISVLHKPPQDPSNSNSILCPECGWHGFIDHGIWQAV